VAELKRADVTYEELANRLRAMGFQETKVSIASKLNRAGFSKTLCKRLRDELDRGVAEANATVSGYLFASAKAGNVTAQIFWLKVRAHWREKTTPDDPVPGSDAEANSPVVLVLPDNSRDPELTEVLRDAQEKYFARKPRR
jgi:Domain of unknown function (DUF6471)